MGLAMSRVVMDTLWPLEVVLCPCTYQAFPKDPRWRCYLSLVEIFYFSTTFVPISEFLTSHAGDVEGEFCALISSSSLTCTSSSHPQLG